MHKVRRRTLVINLLENVYEMSIAVLLLCSFLFYRHLKKTKRERKLSVFEHAMYLITQIAVFLWLASFLLLTYGV
ncbi:hypothetical protein CFK37_19015 [Virgibacillus phasianinus]|uniref:Uncharacterized protein n=1 Tax=Virgibacillus phasianinus TaxID=2017483 RepID=A0A220U8L0_9BACI|nr:hypothetical protein [Virgibacillus phasianinus]ASK64478.1 hypothetical protein CFK37_19015 [Virgibacillus phasianinus]